MQQKNGLANGSSGEYGYMNSSNTNSGSWNGCARRTWCNNVYYNAIASSVFKGIIKQVKVTTAQTYNGSTNQQSDDYIFLPAEREIFDSRTYSNQTEFNALAQWNHYTTASNRIKNQGDAGSAYHWWQRSPLCNNSRYFCGVNSDGSADYSNASNSYLLAPAGCI